jgi:hypothetical protein
VHVEGLNKPELKPAPSKTTATHTKPIQQSNLIHRLSKENTDALQKFKQQLILKSYSPSTIRTYTNEFGQFLNTISNTPANGFSTMRIKDWADDSQIPPHRQCFNVSRNSLATQRLHTECKNVT